MVSIVFELIILSFSVITNLALAVLVFTKNPRRNVNKFFSFFALSLVGWAIVNYLSIHPIGFNQLFWIRFDLAWATIMSTMLLLLANIFPTGIPYYKGIEKFVIVIGTAVGVLTVSPWLFTEVDYSTGSAQPVPGLALPFFVVYVIGVLTLSIIALFRRFFSQVGIAKEYIRYAILGIALTFFLLVIFNFVLVLLFHNTSFIIFTPAISLIFSASFAYGMIRRRLFDVRLVVTRFIAYLLLFLFAGFVYGGVTAGVSFFVAGVQLNFIQITLSSVAAGVLILFVQPLRLFFNRITRALFYQDAYDTKDILDRLASILVRSTDTDILANSSLGILTQALRPKYVSMLLFDETNRGKHRIISIGEEPPHLAHISSAKLLREAPDVLVVDALEDLSDPLRVKMQEANISIIARLETQGGIIGYCFFGYKASGSAYNQRDTDLIRIVSDELAIAIQNALRFEEIRDFNDTLQAKVEAATAQLRHTNSKLRELDEAKDEFVSMASHQLRTPLTSVKGYISMVLEGDVGRISVSQRQLLEEAFTSSERMVHLISDFLNVSRLQTGKFMLEARSVDLSKVIAQEVESLQTTAHSHDLKLRYKAPSYFPMLYIDESKIRQVVMNFIDNAIYYSHEDTTIFVELSVIDGSAVLQVRDTGIGVPKSEQSHLFAKFFRATNARKQRPDGTGVGLFLAKKVIDAHGGTILFESTEGEGSVFGFRLPVKKLSLPPVDSAD